MKLFKYLIELKIKRLDGNDRIIYLANKLSKEINTQGYSVMSPSVNQGFGGFDISIHNHGTKTSVVSVHKVCTLGGDRFEFRGKPEEGLK